MTPVVKNEFSELSCSRTGKVIFQFWTKASAQLSEWEFLEQIDTLFSTAEVFNSDVLCIDAFDFCYPFNKKAIQIISKHLKSSAIKNIGIVMSSKLLGKLHILLLIKSIPPSNNTLSIFNSRKEAEEWLLSIHSR
ncbi:MAG: hypothetical protein HC831_05310 [Chloroflexia bacterium]|nr:hypothetical protein [Bacteroidales bacterium]NJO88438.1 hypothetical protein [Chloroflexia bacterium]